MALRRRAPGTEQLEPEHLLLGLLDQPALGVWRLLIALDVGPERLAALVRVEMAARR